MSVSVISTQITAGGVLKLGLNISSPANYYIRTVWITCGGKNAYYLVPKKNYYTNTVLNLNSGAVVADIPLDLWPNGNINFTVRADHRLNTNSNTISTDAPVEVQVTNTFNKPLGQYLPASYPLGVIEKPVTLTFNVSASVTSKTIPVELVAEDNENVTGYLITRTASVPSTDPSAGWTYPAPASYAVPDYGTYTLYAWAKDADGNVSEPVSTVTTTTPPPPPSALPKGGKFQTGQTVSFINVNGRTIIYTLDGSDPRSYILMNPEGRAIFNPDGDVITTGG